MTLADYAQVSNYAIASATGVLALAFPLHPPGKPEKSRAEELPDLPALMVQGSRDPFGSGQELARFLRQDHELLSIAGGDHSLAVSRNGPLTQAEADEVLATGVGRWLREMTRTAVA